MELFTQDTHLDKIWQWLFVSSDSFLKFLTKNYVMSAIFSKSRYFSTHLNISETKSVVPNPGKVWKIFEWTNIRERPSIISLISLFHLDY